MTIAMTISIERGNYDDNDIDNYHDNVMNKAKTIRMKIMTPSPIK